MIHTDLDYTIRTMTADDLKLAIDWAASEGWNPGLHDAELFHKADPNGFFIGEVDGEPVASISAVAYGDAFGFIGLYIVRPEYRGRRCGIRIWEHAMAYLAGRNVGLDGVVAQQENYRKSGFRLAYRNVRYEGTGGGERPDGLVALAEVPFDVIERYDRRYFPAPRREFLGAWLTQPDAVALGAIEQGELAGYGVIRRCRAGWKIGPLFAESDAVAARLFDGLAASAPGETIYLDAPEVNPAAVALAARHGMQVVFETARMYTGPFPELPLGGTYGVTTFELG